MKTRLAYTKKNEARYIAHLDLTRVFDRALRRARVDVAYSEGFNPHPKIAFGPPLPVGVESKREFVDIDLKGPENGQEKFLAEVVAKLQQQLPEGIELIDFCIRPQGDKAIMAVTNLARYILEVPFLEAVDKDNILEACRRWLEKKEILGVRYQKGKRIERNIRPFVSRINVLSQEKQDVVKMLFDIVTGNAGSVRPVEVLDSLKELEGLPVDIPGVYTVREGLYIEQPDGTLLDPLTK